MNKTTIFPLFLSSYYVLVCGAEGGTQHDESSLCRTAECQDRDRNTGTNTSEREVCKKMKNGMKQKNERNDEECSVRAVATYK